MSDGIESGNAAHTGSGKAVHSPLESESVSVCCVAHIEEKFSALKHSRDVLFRKRGTGGGRARENQL
ncbi:hypothetical protein KFK09_004764 [Dendrobium nobile]|uniref:Uncharacterized protein n=1 Tax=Dendrobium nobile TaxID=94219 RepID=A0A8T3BZ43_DENNO|nr:hypothetical protein KFK09_004764 [Dendrobium nobile]